MTEFLFPPSRVVKPHPINILMEKSDHVRRSVMVVDRSPPEKLMEEILHRVNPTVKISVLFSMESDVDWFYSGISGEAFDGVLKNRSVNVRVMSGLDVRLYIFDDDVVLVSGDPYSETAFCVVLDGSDAQPVIEFWESRWREAEKITRQTVERLLARVQSGRISDADRRKLVDIVNERGAFVTIHVRLFDGHRKILLEPVFWRTDVPSFWWTLVRSYHFKALKPSVARIYALKRRPYCIETPFGIFVRSSDRRQWEADFREREMQFQQDVAAYLQKRYRTIKKEAREALTEHIENIRRWVQEINLLLPMGSFDNMSLDEYMFKNYMKLFPSRTLLAESCHTWFVSFGLHPAFAEDEWLVRLLLRSAVQLRMI